MSFDITWKDVMPMFPVDKDKAIDLSILIAEAMLGNPQLDVLGEADSETLMYAVAMVLVGIHATSRNFDPDVTSFYVETMAGALITGLDAGYKRFTEVEKAKSESIAKKCPDCGVLPGELHSDGCDVQRCPLCGGQFFSCDCDGDDEEIEKLRMSKRLPWTGLWPGEAECIEYGWYVVWVNPGPGWVECDANTPGAQPNLSRLVATCRWDVDKGRFVKKD